MGISYQKRIKLSDADLKKVLKKAKELENEIGNLDEAALVAEEAELAARLAKLTSRKTISQEIQNTQDFQINLEAAKQRILADTEAVEVETPLKAKNHNWNFWGLVAAAAAGHALLVYVDHFTPIAFDEVTSDLHGPMIAKGTAEPATIDCSFLLQGQEGEVADGGTRLVLASDTYAVKGRCDDQGYLHVTADMASGRQSWRNIEISASSSPIPLRDAGGELATLVGIKEAFRLSFFVTADPIGNETPLPVDWLSAKSIADQPISWAISYDVSVSK